MDFQIHILEDFVARVVIEKGLASGEALAQTVRHHPASSALSVCFAISAVAAGCLGGEVFKGQDRRGQGVDLLKALGAFVMDVYAVERIIGQMPSCLEMTTYWYVTGENYFPTTTPLAAAKHWPKTMSQPVW